MQNTPLPINSSMIFWTILIDMIVIMWIIRDSHRRNMNPFFWSILTLFSPLIGIIGHLLARKPKIKTGNPYYNQSTVEEEKRADQTAMESPTQVIIQVATPSTQPTQVGGNQETMIIRQTSKPPTTYRPNTAPENLTTFAHQEENTPRLQKFCPMCQSPRVSQGQFCGHCGYQFHNQ